MKTINEEKIKFILNLKRKGIRDKEVLRAMETINRRLFLDGIFQSRSEDDIPLPISCGQTISQPSVVAKMIEKLESKRHTSYIWATKDGIISVDDRITDVNGLSKIMYSKITKDPKLTVSLKSDEKATMKMISDIHTQLRKANALKLSYSSLTKSDK